MSKSISKFAAVLAVAVFAAGSIDSAHALTGAPTTTTTTTTAAPIDKDALAAQQELDRLRATVNRVNTSPTTATPGLRNTAIPGIAGPVTSNTPTIGRPIVASPIGTISPNQLAQARSAIATINQISNLNGKQVLNNAEAVAKQAALSQLQSQLGLQLNGIGNVSNLPANIKNQLTGAVRGLPNQVLNGIGSSVLGRIGLGGLFGGSGNAGSLIANRSAEIRRRLAVTGRRAVEVAHIRPAAIPVGTLPNEVRTAATATLKNTVSRTLPPQVVSLATRGE